MSENFDYALSHVATGYVMFIGDDDGVMPNSLEYVNNIINITKTEAVVSHNAHYTWPGSRNPNKLFWSFKKNYEKRDSKTWLKEFVKFEMLYTFDLPSAYCGFIKKEIFDKLTTNNSYFKSATPDAYSALATCLSTNFYIYSHRAFAVHGASKFSNGGSYFSTKKNEEGQEAKKFFKENSIPFNKKIVMTKSFRVCALEALLQLKEEFPCEAEDIEIDWCLFLSHVLTERNSITYSEVTDAVKKMCQLNNVQFERLKIRNNNKYIRYFLKNGLVNGFKNIFLRKYFKHSINNTYDFGVKNINDAVILLDKYLR
jgi:hypothetical protein